ncbi:MAG: ABC transporter ATP-binding protein [Thermoleophilia bacterium]|nr:ABC transporter ATP-binding protein [Thermoleophilia bacterium]
MSAPTPIQTPTLVHSETFPATAADNGRRIVLSTHGLTKDFGKLRALDHLDLTIYEGDVFGFLGPNGAGKTTALRLIFGLTYPTSGYVNILGYRVPEQRREALRYVGGFVDDPMFYPNMSAKRNLQLIAEMNQKVSPKRISEVLELVGLADRANSKVGSYSHGMRQRLGIALALIHRPALVVLDEPTSGLDPQGMRHVRELIRELGRQGITVLLSSHLLHEVELVCNRAAIINKGRLVVQGPVSELRPADNIVKILTRDQSKAAEVIQTLAPPEKLRQDGDYLVLQDSPELIPEVIRRLVNAGIDVLSVAPTKEHSLEEMFLELTGDGEEGS